MNQADRKRRLLLTAALVLHLDEDDIQNKRKWSKQWLLERRKYSHMNLLRELQSNEPADYRNKLLTDGKPYIL